MVRYMSFGKFKDKRLVDLPSYYVHWMVNATGFFRDKPTLLKDLIKLGKIKEGASGPEAVGYNPQSRSGCYFGFGSFYYEPTFDDCDYYAEEWNYNEEHSDTYHGSDPRGEGSESGAAGQGSSEHAEDTQRTPKGQSTHARGGPAAEEPAKKRQRDETGQGRPLEEPAAVQAADLSYLCQGFPSLDTMTVAELKKVLQQVMLTRITLWAVFDAI